MTEGRWGIGQKFILFISLSVLVFLVAIFLITRDVLGDYALATADELAETILDQTDKRLGQFFEEMEHLARGLAGTRAVRSADEGAMGDLFVATVLPRSRYLRAVYLGTEDGRMFEWGVGKGFTDYRPSFPPGYDPRARPWYRTALERNGFAISDPYIYASVDDIGITCALPVTGPDGSRVGVLGLDILLEDLRRILEGLEIPKEGKALLVSSTGVVVASQFPGDRAADPSQKGFALPFSREEIRGPSGSFTAEIEDEETHFVYKRTSRADWTIAVGMPLGSILESMRTLLNIISMVEIILMLMLTLALAGITGRLILSPLAGIVAVINRLKAGDKAARVQVRSGDEFGVLGEEFNMLVDEVDGYSRNLEEKVRQRTEEIWQLQKENTQLRVVEERRRIYRDMHDTLGAKLTNIFFCGGMARDLAKDGPERLREMLDAVESNCLAAVDSLRGIVRGMHEDDRMGSDLVKFVSAGMRQRLESRDIDFDCRIRNRKALRDLGDETRTEIEKVLDELVSNTLKHSGASRVRLRLSAGTRGILLRFSDDGVGFDPAGSRAGSFGLANVRYRVERLGGTVSVRSAPGRGAEYSAILPARREDHDEP